MEMLINFIVILGFAVFLISTFIIGVYFGKKIKNHKEDNSCAEYSQELMKILERQRREYKNFLSYDGTSQIDR